MEVSILRTLAILTYKQKSYKSIYEMIRDMLKDNLDMFQIRSLILDMYDEQETDYIMRTYWAGMDSTNIVSNG